jgi:exonuclease III
VRTLHQDGRSKLFLREIKRFEWDIIGLSEVRWLGSGTKSIDGHDIIFSGHDKRHIGGVGLLLSPRARQAMINVDAVNYRLIYARFRGQGFNLSVIQVYAPTTESTDAEIDEFYQILQMKIDAIDRSDVLLVIGDLNAKVGKDHLTWQDNIGPHGLGSVNERGERLLEFCCVNQLCISNTYFPHKPSRKWTWAHPNGRSKNMIDYIMINRRWKNSILDCRSFPSADAGTDHQLLICKLRLKLKCTQMINSPCTKRHDLDKLHNSDMRSLYQRELQNRFTGFKEQAASLDQLADQYSSTLKAVADKVQGFRKAVESHGYLILLWN